MLASNLSLLAIGVAIEIDHLYPTASCHHLGDQAAAGVLEMVAGELTQARKIVDRERLHHGAVLRHRQRDLVGRDAAGRRDRQPIMRRAEIGPGVEFVAAGRDETQVEGQIELLRTGRSKASTDRFVSLLIPLASRYDQERFVSRRAKVTGPSLDIIFGTD
jgi:hypothetical protein